VEIAKLLMELEEEMTKPQDFEWGIEKAREWVCVCVHVRVCVWIK
jgi:hypothetical protein